MTPTVVIGIVEGSPGSVITPQAMSIMAAGNGQVAIIPRCTVSMNFMLEKNFSPNFIQSPFACISQNRSPYLLKKSPLAILVIGNARLG